MSNYLNEELQKSLRAQGIIRESEVVEKQGDLYIAVDVVAGTRRPVVFDRSILSESNKRILRG